LAIAVDGCFSDRSTGEGGCGGGADPAGYLAGHTLVLQVKNT